MIEITFTPTRADLTAAHRLAVLNRFFRLAAWKSWLAAAIVGVVVGGGASYINAYKYEAFLNASLRGVPMGIAIYLALFAVIITLLYLCAPLLARWSLRTSKTLAEHYTIRVDEQGMHTQGQSNSGERKWSGLIGWSENAKVVLMYPSSAMFQFVPKRAFANSADIDQLRNWLIAAGVPRIAPFR